MLVMMRMLVHVLSLPGQTMKRLPVPMMSGALLLCWGVSDTEYVFSDFPREKISLKAEVFEDRWTLDLTVPFDLVRHHLPGFEPKAGMIIHGNFYKCGDETASPHFGCYFPIDPEKVPRPRFHKPEYYGKLLLGN